MELRRASWCFAGRGAWAGGVGGFCEGRPTKLCEALRAPAKLFAGWAKPCEAGRSTKHEARSTTKQKDEALRSSTKHYEGAPPLQSGGNPPCLRRRRGVHAGPAAGLPTATYWQLMATYSWGSQKGLKQGPTGVAQRFKRGSFRLARPFTLGSSLRARLDRSKAHSGRGCGVKEKGWFSPSQQGGQRSTARRSEAQRGTAKHSEALRSTAKPRPRHSEALRSPAPPHEALRSSTKLYEALRRTTK